MLCWSLKTDPWYRLYFVMVGIALATKKFKLLLLTSLGKEIVVQICWLIWVIRHKARFGSRCCRSLFRLISSWTGVGSLALGSRRQMFLFFRLLLFLLFCPPPFNKFFLWHWRHRMGVLRGANLVGMSLLPLDACPISWLSQKKKKTWHLVLIPFYYLRGTWLVTWHWHGKIWLG